MVEPQTPSPSPLAGEGGEPAISAFTRVLDALWRASRVRRSFDTRPLTRTLASARVHPLPQGERVLECAAHE